MIPARHGDSIRLISVCLRGCVCVCVSALLVSIWITLLTMRDMLCAVLCCACTNLHDFFSNATVTASTPVSTITTTVAAAAAAAAVCGWFHASLWLYLFSTEEIGSFAELERAIIFKMCLEGKTLLILNSLRHVLSAAKANLFQPTMFGVRLYVTPLYLYIFMLTFVVQRSLFFISLIY